MATPNYGTLSTLDTLASSQQTIAQIGEDRAFEAIDLALKAHNLIVEGMLGDFCEVTTDRLRRFGNPNQMKMQELDEFGSPDAQKISAGQLVGFPLRLYGDALQWTRKFMQNAKASELAAQTTALMDADEVNVILQTKRALFYPVNYTSDDRLVDHLQAIPLPIKALANADGGGLPIGPNGEVFNGATHTHYLTCAVPGTLNVADGQALVGTVVEHFNNGSPRIYIAKGDEQSWRSLAGFVGYFDARIIQPTTAASAPGVPLDVVNINNRAIGVFAGAEVWVKPWMVQGYAFAWVSGQQRPLVFRVRDTAANALVLIADDDDHPLRARQYEREFGIGVGNRVNGAMLDMTHAVYTQPVLT